MRLLRRLARRRRQRSICVELCIILVCIACWLWIKNSSFAIPRVSQPLKIRYAVPHYLRSICSILFSKWHGKFGLFKTLLRLFSQLFIFKPLVRDRMKEQLQIPSFFSKYLMIFHGFAAPSLERSTFEIELFCCSTRVKQSKKSSFIVVHKHKKHDVYWYIWLDSLVTQILWFTCILYRVIHVR